MQRARLEYPDDYTAYQRFRASNSTQQQYGGHTAAGGWGNTVGKSAPTTYEDLVNAEIAKGFSRELAGQRVAQAHGYRALDHVGKSLRKGADAQWEFQKRVDEVMYDDGVDASEATRRVRLEDPNLFRALQRSGRRF